MKQLVSWPSGVSEPLLGSFRVAASQPGTPTLRHQRSRRRLAAAAIAGALATAALLLNTAFWPDEFAAWRKSGCRVKIIGLVEGMPAALESARAAGAVDPAGDLGAPRRRAPRTAVVNLVRFHTEVVAALAYHAARLGHNVTTFTDRDDFGMADVMRPYAPRPFRRYPRFYDSFWEFDTVVLATFPTCHAGTLRALLAAGLPQRYVLVVHNPRLLADAALAPLLADPRVRLLTIAPHVGAAAVAAAAAAAAAAGGAAAPRADWLAPVFPVVFPEQCAYPWLLSRAAGYAWDQPACNRSALWGEGRGPPPAAVAALGTEGVLGAPDLSAVQLTAAEEAAAAAAAKVKSAAVVPFTEEAAAASRAAAVAAALRVRRAPAAAAAAAARRRAWAAAGGPPPPPRRSGFCVQGKLDPARRDYGALFAGVRAARAELAAAGSALVLQGKGAGKHGEETMAVPRDLLDAGLVRKYTALPFQEYYELLHSCEAVLPAFNSDAYYRDKGSSSVAAALVAGTPLVATRRLLRAYSFLDASAVFLVPEGTPDAEAMRLVLALPPEVRAAKAAAAARLRNRLYARNLEALQRLLDDGAPARGARKGGAPAAWVHAEPGASPWALPGDKGGFA